MAPRALIVDDKNQYFTGHYQAQHDLNEFALDEESAFPAIPIFDPDPYTAYQYQTPQGAEIALRRLTESGYPDKMAVVVEPEEEEG